MSGVMRPLHRLYAEVMGYFWINCRRCGKGFGGHQWRSMAQTDANGTEGARTCVYCPRCAPSPADGFDAVTTTNSPPR